MLQTRTPEALCEVTLHFNAMCNNTQYYSPQTCWNLSLNFTATHVIILWYNYIFTMDSLWQYTNNQPMQFKSHTKYTLKIFQYIWNAFTNIPRYFQSNCNKNLLKFVLNSKLITTCNIINLTNKTRNAKILSKRAAEKYVW